MQASLIGIEGRERRDNSAGGLGGFAWRGASFGSPEGHPVVVVWSFTRRRLLGSSGVATALALPVRFA